MNKEIAITGLQLLARVDLKGEEVGAYLRVVQALEVIANAPEAKSAAKEESVPEKE